MWKKFFISILSIAFVGGAVIASGELFAMSVPSIQIIESEQTAQYIHDPVSFVISGLAQDEQVQYIEGGSVEGNQETYTIPFIESDTFEIKGLTKPGAYHGSVKVSIMSKQGSNDVEESFSFLLYGKVFHEENVKLAIGEEKELLSYGILPETLSSPRYVYTSNQPSILEVNEQGKVIAKQQGDAQITLQVYDEDTLLSETKCNVQVLDTPKAEPQFETAIQGEEYGYRFISQHTADTMRDQQSVGFFQLAQSGEHAYYFEEDMQEQFEVIDGYLYVQQDIEEKEYETTVYILHKDSGKLYRVPIVFTKQEHNETTTTPFQFRYDGKDVKSIVRPYQYGNNSFQIASNQSIDQVSFKLKNEEDYEYLTISQTGNVTVKKVTKNPVIILATYHKETYECMITIEKSEQLISTKHDRLRLSLEDGVADPLILGRKGEGSLVFSSDDASIVDVRMHTDGTSSILPIKEGITQIHVFNNGDDVYKKSNILTIEVEVIKEVEKDTMLQGSADWLKMEEAQGTNGWHTKPVQISLQRREDLIGFSYQGNWVQEITISDNGELVLPIMFQNQAKEESTPVKVQLQIDTQPPLIANIVEEDAANTEVKRFLNQITFAKSYGRGKNITIAASDQLIDTSIKTSGIAKIVYRIYKMEEETEVLLAQGEEETQDRIVINVEDTGVHKVCAYAIDQAGLQGAETCQQLTEEQPQLVPTSNTGILLRAKHDVITQEIEVIDARDRMLKDASIDKYQIQAAYAFVNEQAEEISIENTIELLLPISNDTMQEQGIWKQMSSTGSYESVPVTYDTGICTLTLDSLRPVIYVQDDTQTQEHPLLLQPKQIEPTESINHRVTSVTSLPQQSFLCSEDDIQIFLYAGGGVFIGLFILLLIRCAKEESEDEIR